MRPPRTKRERCALALANPYYFGELYVRPYDAAWRDAGPLPHFAAEMLSFGISSPRPRGVVILPPEFLKTTLLSQVLPLWLTVRATWQQQMLRGMLLSEEEGMAAANLSVVKWHIDNNERLAADFSDSKGRPLVAPDPDEKTWREDAIITVRHGTSKDPTWQAKGLDSKGIQGRRLDWLIGDDVITPKNAFSPAMRRTALNLWDLQITTRLVRSGRAIIAGNFNDERDLVSTLAKRKSYDVFRRPALHEPGKPDVAAEDGEALWPENWSKARLATERADKPQRFRRIFLLDPRAEAGDKLRLEWVTIINPSDTPLHESRFTMALDPAPGGSSEDLDFFNISVLAEHGSHADLIASIDVRRDIPGQISLVGAIFDRFDRVGLGVKAIGGAKVAMDRYLRGAITAVRPELAAKLVEVSIPGSKIERLEALGPYAKSGWLRVWHSAWEEATSDGPDQYQELSLLEQWKDFPHGKHDDKLDGLDVAIRAAREFTSPADVEYVLEVA